MFLAKMIGNLVFLLVIQALAVPIFTLFFVDSYAADLPAFLAVLLLADIGVCAVGTLLATISMNTKARDLLLPIVFLPLIIPRAHRRHRGDDGHLRPDREPRFARC